MLQSLFSIGEVAAGSVVQRMVGVWLMVVLCISPALSDIYTALVDMEELLESEAALIRTLEDYIASQENNLQLIKK